MKIPALVAAVSLVLTAGASAQVVQPGIVTPTAPVLLPTSTETPVAAPLQLGNTRPAATERSPIAPTPSGLRSVVSTIGHDTSGFFSKGTLRVLVPFAVMGAVARPFDNGSVEDANEALPGRFASAGNMVGGTYFQLGGAAATWLAGRASGHPAVAGLGVDLFRAQILSQMFVQGAKFAVHRTRPDGSNAMSFPSGHTASAFATATILQDELGWKAGVPAYALAGFVAASRMASEKHYLSDVLVGAGIGIAAGKTISLHVGHHAFALGAAPTAGGAMVTFTKQK